LVLQSFTLSSFTAFSLHKTTVPKVAQRADTHTKRQARKEV